MPDTAQPLAARLIETSDAPATNATPYSMGAGDVFAGDLSVIGDRDRVAITLSEGSAYQISLSGASSGAGTLSDPYLRIYDSSGNQVAFNDDSGGTLESSLNFAPSASGTYYIEAGSFAGLCCAKSMNPGLPLSPDGVIPRPL